MGFFNVNDPYHAPHLFHSGLKLHFSASANLVAIFHLHSAFQNLMKSFVKIIWKKGHNLYIKLFYTLLFYDEQNIKILFYFLTIYHLLVLLLFFTLHRESKRDTDV